MSLGSTFRDSGNLESGKATADSHSILDFNPAGQVEFIPQQAENNTLNFNIAGRYNNNFIKMQDNNLLFDHVIILNHNMQSHGYKFKLDVGSSNYDDSYWWANYGTQDVLNAPQNTGGYHIPAFDGITILKITGTPDWGDEAHKAIRFRFDPVDESEGYGGNLKIGSVIFAKKFTMETTPIKNYSMQFLSNTSKQTSYNGLSYTNTMSPHGTSAFMRNHLHDIYRNAYKGRAFNGYRKWNIAFNALRNDELNYGVFPVNEAANRLPDENSYNYMDYTSDIYDDFSSGIPESQGRTFKGNDFTSRVWTLTNGFTEPFLFHQSEINSPDQYAIARINAKSFAASQVANGVFNMKLSITEGL